MLEIEVFTLFPGMFESVLQETILGRAQSKELVSIRVRNIRDHATDRHHVTDDAPYGGGGGMVMKPEPIFAAVESALGSPPRVPIILLSPQGKVFDQARAWELSRESGFALLSGRYEGVDERVRDHLAAEALSIGDYVLSGGELAAMVVIEAVVRLIPGALGDEDGAVDDSLSSGLLEYPHYTRPALFRGWRVPEVLLSGNHEAIRRWRREQSLWRTFVQRPDLLARAPLSVSDREALERLRKEHAAQEKDPGKG
ncbi:MAG: tRNA (guanosine(37)-N1)-methyltransferase TrmD [Anaerolineales bacterium]|jgi:tRNA (guanine37-N1)-methyltransferase